MPDQYPKLWLSNGSCALAPHILLHEASIPFKPITIDVIKGFPSYYLHVNPKGKVPILQLDDANTITESPAILTAISQMRTEKHLMGKTPLDTVRCYEWLNWLSGTVHGQCYGAFFRPYWYSSKEEHFETIVAHAKEKILKNYEYIDEKLEGKIFAVGDGFTAVDAFLIVLYRWGSLRLGVDMKERFPNFARVVLGVAERESAKKAMNSEGITLTS